MIQVILTPETATQLERDKERLEREITKLRAEHELVCRKLEAIPLFLAEANGGPAPEPHKDTAADSRSSNKISAVDMSVPMAVKSVLQEHGRLSAREIREAVLRAGISRERLGSTFSYLYTVLGRLQERGQIQRVRGKYQLPPGVTFHYQPEESDLK